jgi:hypothetical protein
VPNWFSYLSNFVDVGKNLIMADDVATPLDSLVTPIEKEKLEEVSLDVNVSQQSREEELSRRMVRTRVDHSAWDHRLSPNPHALTIYSKFVLARGAALERFEKC